jgi:hypothetical protein
VALLAEGHRGEVFGLKLFSDEGVVALIAGESKLWVALAAADVFDRLKLLLEVLISLLGVHQAVLDEIDRVCDFEVSLQRVVLFAFLVLNEALDVLKLTLKVLLHDPVFEFK